MTTRFAAVDFLTFSYRISGKVGLTSAGVMGLLANPTSSFIDVHEANMSYIHAPNKLASQSAVMGITKAKVSAICLSRRDEIGPVAVFRGSYVKLNPYPIRITTPVFQIEGTLEWSGRFNFSTLMAEDIFPFIPMFDAVLQAILFPAFRIESPALLFNRNYVETLSLLRETL